MAEIARSGYLDAGSWRLTDPAATTVAQALHLTDVRDANANYSITMAVMVERANDPTALLALPWAERQATLKAMTDDGTLWSTYGGKAQDYAKVQSVLSQYGTVHGSADGYGNDDTRTVWVTLTADAFEDVFGAKLKSGSVQNAAGTSQKVHFWEGNLSSDTLGVSVGGLLIENIQTPVAIAAQDGTGQPAKLHEGRQSVGNASTDRSTLFPNQIADLYDFPLPDVDTTTATIGIVAPGMGATVENGKIQTLIDRFRALAGVSGSGSVSGDEVPTLKANPAFLSERALDLGVVSTAAPNSDIVLYAGGPVSNAAAAMHQAIWDDRQADVLSISYHFSLQTSPDSPFRRAYSELGTDAALRNITVLNSSGDGGSGGKVGNGIPMVDTGSGGPYVVLVGGTSLATVEAAVSDRTLNRENGLFAAAMAHDPSTLSHLIAGGLKQLPTTVTGITPLFETVWNQYWYKYNPEFKKYEIDYTENDASGGGIDPTIAQPKYQTDYGLDLVGAGPFQDRGRARPDVSALSSGDMRYNVPGNDLTGLSTGGGTSASAPLWAALTAQLDAVFADQGLPNLGYMNDLLYQAAAVAPGAYNDIIHGNNRSTYIQGGDIISIRMQDKEPITQDITPTGFGYEAHAGYDLTTGLGSPNGLLLARALTAIAHTQTHEAAPGLLAEDGTSATAQHLLVQGRHTEAGTAVAVGAEDSFQFEESHTYAWSNTMAQKALQADFDPDLVRLFDGASQATPHDLTVAAGEALPVSLDGQAVSTFREALTNPFGFVEYRDVDSASEGGHITLARSVTVAQNAGGADDQQAIVRLRSNGANTENALSFYEVDDLAGRIDGLAPGEAGYAAAAAARSYVSTAGATTIAAPGQGDYAEHRLVGVDHGDLIAMRLTNGTDTFWGFSPANEAGADGRGATHLWSYGLNTWGWEDLRGGGDRDFNDVLVQLDFTSTAGSQWLV